MELLSDADDLRWAVSIGRAHGAAESLLQELSQLADHVQAAANAEKTRAHQGGLTVNRTWRDRIACRVSAWAARGNADHTSSR